MTTFGPSIPHEPGKPKPEWLGDDEPYEVQFSTCGGCWHSYPRAGWDSVTALRIRADHPASIATAKGFTYWPGGTAAYAAVDWDKGPVLLDDGSLCEGYYSSSAGWKKGLTLRHVIGYKRRAKTPASPLDEAAIREKLQLAPRSLKSNGPQEAAIREAAIRECLAALPEEEPLTKDWVESYNGGLSDCRRVLTNLLPKPEPTAAERYADSTGRPASERASIIDAYNAGSADRG